MTSMQTPDPAIFVDEGTVRVLSFRRDERGAANPELVRRFFTGDFQNRTAEAQRLVIDLGGVASLDSASLGPLVQRLRDMQQSKGRLALTGVDAPALKEIFALTRFDKVFAIYPDRASAVAALRG